MFYGGELNVPGAAGNNARTMEYRYGRDDRGTAVPIGIGYTPQPTSIMGLPGGIGNEGALAHGKHTPDEVIHGIPRYWHPGSHDPVQHNPLVDPAGNFIPGTAPKDSEIPLAKQTGGMMPGQPGNMAFQVAGGNWLDPRTWMSGEAQQKIDKAKEGTFRAAPNEKGLGNRLLDRNSRIKNMIDNM